MFEIEIVGLVRHSISISFTSCTSGSILAEVIPCLVTAIIFFFPLRKV